MNKIKFYYILVFLYMVFYSLSAIYYESYFWLVGTLWYFYYLFKWFPIWNYIWQRGESTLHCIEWVQ